MPMDREVPPPTIGKIGPYTVFVTPPPAPKPTLSHSDSQSPLKIQSPPPVLPPPPHYSPSPSHASSFGFFWNAVSKLQNAHSSLDESVAHWFGLNQSKYQWALDEYYESNGQKTDRVDGKPKDKSNKIESV